jgi:hypothetical protein
MLDTFMKPAATLVRLDGHKQILVMPQGSSLFGPNQAKDIFRKITINSKQKEEDRLIKRLIAVTVLISLLCAVVDARMPQIGDNVRILAGSGTTEMRYEGAVTDIGNGFICINATEAIEVKDGTPYLEEGENQIEICIGIGYITMLRVLNA